MRLGRREISLFASLLAAFLAYFLASYANSKMNGGALDRIVIVGVSVTF